tara:strand:- start:32 stop:208 length:177 start_codon:yes stop_codon:yes gene_type:complete
MPHHRLVLQNSWHLLNYTLYEMAYFLIVYHEQLMTLHPVRQAQHLFALQLAKYLYFYN